MGGKNSVLRAGASDFVGATTAGVVDLENGKVNTNLKDIGANYASSISMGDTMNSLTPQMPKAPVAEDPTIQAKRAEAEAAAKLAKEVGERGKGLSSTILGGSTSTDSSVLKKRKLLGE